jgi:hypothetical protein
VQLVWAVLWSEAKFTFLLYLVEIDRFDSEK